MADNSRNLYLEVEEISADMTVAKELLAKILAVQERQEVALKTIAACLEKITGAMTTYSGQPALGTFIVNADSCRG